MVATTIGSAAGVIICTDISGGAPDLTTGTVVYLVSTKVMGPYRNLSKLTNTAAGFNYSNRDGKRNWSIEIKDCYVQKYGAVATNTAAFNAYLQFFKDRTKVGVAPVYLFIYNYVDSDYIQLGDGVDYLLGYPLEYPFEKEEGLYKFTTIKFGESS